MQLGHAGKLGEFGQSAAFVGGIAERTPKVQLKGKGLTYRMCELKFVPELFVKRVLRRGEMSTKSTKKD